MCDPRHQGPPTFDNDKKIYKYIQFLQTKEPEISVEVVHT